MTSNDEYGFTGLIDRVFEGDPGSYDEIRNSTLLRGAGIVLLFAWLESHYTEAKWSTLVNPPSSWQHSEEWRNLYLIRHCFAHYGDGTLLNNHKQAIIDFQQKFVNKDLQDVKSRDVEAYYQVNNDKIKLESSAVRRCRSLCHQFLDQFPP